MRTFFDNRMSGRRLALVVCGTVLGVGVVMIGPAVAFEHQEQIVRVEEDWKLVLNEPNDAVNAPQFHTVMSPYGNVDSVYLQATWNYQEEPDFAAGGLQLQAWNGEECALSRGFLDGRQLSTDAETVTWTQVLDINESIVSFEIINGRSVTWGSFGGGSMKLQGELYPADLNAYSPQVSRANSFVSYGSNRVDLLVITEVRYYGREGLLHRDTTPKVVLQNQSETDGE
jgi:hypothetical protein